MAKKTTCACGNPKCRVAELTERAARQKPAADVERADRGPFRRGYGRAEVIYQNTDQALNSASRECSNRKQLLALGPTCPLCGRPVAAYGMPADGNTCGIVGEFQWRRRGDDWRNNEIESECKAIAWPRLMIALEVP